VSSAPSTKAESPDEMQGIFEWLAEKPTIARHVSAVRRLDELREREPERFASVRLLVVRNFTIEPIEPLLKIAAYRAGLHLDVTYSGYDPAPDDELDSLLADGASVVLLLLRLEDIAPILTERSQRQPTTDVEAIADDVVARVMGLARRIREGSGATILLQNFVMAPAPAAGLADSQDPAGELNLVRHMNRQLASSLREIDGSAIVDADHLFAKVGLERCYDERSARMAGAPFTQDALRVLADAYVRHVKAMDGPAVKCIVLDCDNTLWGGVIGEDGPAGIALGPIGPGRAFTALQEDLRDLRQRGLVLAICSKNESADVLDVLRNHPHSVLREDDFAAMRIDWEDKAANISAIADELNIGLEHIVFVDDSDIECEWVKQRLPDVHVIQWPMSSDEGTSLRDLPLFDSLVVTEEDRARTEMYRSEAKRRAARTDDVSREGYLRSLEMEATVGLATSQQLPRLAQLTQRTNQFNLTTRRYDVAALEKLAIDPNSRVVWLELQDRFGSNGIVGCGILRVASETASIDSLMLSCRVIGRDVETVLVNRLAIIAREMGATILMGEFIPSDRNGQVADLYTRLGFARVEPHPPSEFWSWDLTAGLPASADHLHTVDQALSGS
jgi:FkbH-like protein